MAGAAAFASEPHGSAEPVYPAAGSSNCWPPLSIEVGGIHLHSGPWVSGMRAAAYFGCLPHSIHRTRGCDVEEALAELLEGLADKARALGANAVAGVELSIDPWAWLGDVACVHLHVVGSSARLEPLY
jgi:hypothetical protein